jgi:tetratricopeptide (TPR) repeat protein
MLKGVVTRMKKEEMQRLVQQAETLCEKEKYREALAVGEELVSRWPDEMLPYYIRGRARWGTKRYTEALEDLSKALAMEPAFARTWYYHGNVLYGLMRYKEALESYNRAIEIDPDYYNAYNGKGNVLYGLKLYKEALESYNRAIEIDPDCYKAPNNKGAVLTELKRYEEALENYNRAIEINPDSSEVYNNKGVTLENLKRYEEALESYNRAISLEENAIIFRNRARLYEGTEQYDEALDDYKKSLAIDPDNSYTEFSLQRLINSQRSNTLTAEPIPEHKENEHKEKPNEKDDWKEMVNRAAKRFLMTEESNGGFPEGEAADLDSALVQRIQQYHQDKQQKSIEKSVENNISSFKQFTTDQRLPDNLPNYEFYMLRRWNSYTPIVTHNNGASKGGGYFLHMGASGAVIDPGFNFIENFQEWGFSFSQIDRVFITHAHNDHDADLESILTLLYVYNKDIKKKIVEDLVKKVLSWDSLEPDINTEDAVYQYMNKEKNARYVKERKVIDLYLTVGAFKKHATRLELRRDGEYRVHVIKSNEKPIEIGKGVTIRPICAKHFDLMSDCDAVGFVIEFASSAIVYTGDTGFSPEIGKQYQALREEFSKDKKSVTLLAHIGGFKAREKDTNLKSIASGKAFYKDHLGRNGLICLVDILRPQCCIISEFGEEFDGYRESVANLFTETFKDKNIRFLPADIGLCINSDMKIWAIVDTECPDEMMILKREFIAPDEVRAMKLKNGSLSYHHCKYETDEKTREQLRFNINAVCETSKQQRPKH